jgi:hypothetical protein
VAAVVVAQVVVVEIQVLEWYLQVVAVAVAVVRLAAQPK